MKPRIVFLVMSAVSKPATIDQLARALLTREGCAVTHVPNGQASLEAVDLGNLGLAAAELTPAPAAALGTASASVDVSSVPLPSVTT